MAGYRRRGNAQPAGELRHRLVFLRREIAVESGKSRELWTPAFECWGKAEPLSGREYWSAAAVSRESEWRFTIRYREGVTASMRIRYGGVDFDITSVIDPDLCHVKLEILASSVLETKG